MNTLLTVIAHLLRNLAVLVQPGGAKSIIAENLLLKQQLLALNRSRKRAPNLPPMQRLFFAFWCHFLRLRRIQRSALTLRPSTLFRMHAALVQRKFRLLFSSKPRRQPGPKGPSPELIQAVLEFKRRNPRCGCPRIAQQIADTFGIDLDKDIVRRILAKHFNPARTDQGPSWLAFLGHSKDSLWSLDFFRTESITLKAHWILVVMDQYSRRLIGTIRREYLDHLFYWNAEDLRRKLEAFKIYFNEFRVHSGIGGQTPAQRAELAEPKIASLNSYIWKSHCHGLFEMPNAA